MTAMDDRRGAPTARSVRDDVVDGTVGSVEGAIDGVFSGIGGLARTVANVVALPGAAVAAAVTDKSFGEVMERVDTFNKGALHTPIAGTVDVLTDGTLGVVGRTLKGGSPGEAIHDTYRNGESVVRSSAKITMDGIRGRNGESREAVAEHEGAGSTLQEMPLEPSTPGRYRPDWGHLAPEAYRESLQESRRRAAAAYSGVTAEGIATGKRYLRGSDIDPANARINYEEFGKVASLVNAYYAKIGKPELSWNPDITTHNSRDLGLAIRELQVALGFKKKGEAGYDARGRDVDGSFGKVTFDAIVEQLR